MSAAPFDESSVLGPPERREIAQRTRDALQAAKRRGQRLGGPVRLPDDVRGRIATMRDQGATLQAIADTLTDEGVDTAQGGARWYRSTVAGVLGSLELDAEAAQARHEHFCATGQLAPR